LKIRPSVLSGAPTLNIVSRVLKNALFISSMISVNFWVRPMPSSSAMPVVTICTMPISAEPPMSNRLEPSTTLMCAAQPKNAASGAPTSEAHQHSFPPRPFSRKNGTSSFWTNSRSKQMMAAAIRHSAKPMSLERQDAVTASTAPVISMGVFFRGAKYSTSPAPNSRPMGMSE